MLEGPLTRTLVFEHLVQYGWLPYYYIPYLYSTVFINYTMFKSALQCKTYKRKMIKWHGIIYIKCKIKYYNILVIHFFGQIKSNKLNQLN